MAGVQHGHIGAKGLVPSMHNQGLVRHATCGTIYPRQSVRLAVSVAYRAQRVLDNRLLPNVQTTPGT